MVELLVTLLLLVIAVAGASLIYDKNKDKILSALANLNKKPTVQKAAPQDKPKPKRSTPESLYAEFQVENKSGKPVTLEEFKKLLKQPANIKAVNTVALAAKQANDALKKREISMSQAVKNIEDALKKANKYGKK